MSREPDALAADATFNIALAIERVLAIQPTALAVHFDERWYTWAYLRQVGDDLLEAINDAGVTPDHDVLVLLRNRPPMLGVVLGLFRAARCLTSGSPILPDAALAEDIQRLRPAVVVAAPEDWARQAVRDAVTGIGALALEVSDEGFVRRAEGFTYRPSSGHHVVKPGTAVHMLSSGTTGMPKRIKIMSVQLARATAATSAHHGGPSRPDEALQLRAGATILELPLFHISALGSLIATVVAGRQLCVLERFDPVSWGKAVHEHELKVASLVPAGLRMVLDADVPKEWLSSLKVVRTGSAPLAADLAVEFGERYGVPVLQAYGATEFAGGASSMTTQDLRRFGEEKLRSVGRIHPGIEAKIVDSADDRELPPNEVGLLLLRAAQLSPMEPAEWVRTNDIAHIDGDGFLYIRGRADDVIIRGGFKVDVGELEREIRGHPAVIDVGVVDLPDARLGQVPGAVVVVDPEAGDPPSPQELKEWLRDRVAPYKVPTVIRLVDALPRNSTMKVPRPALRELLQPSDARKW